MAIDSWLNRYGVDWRPKGKQVSAKNRLGQHMSKRFQSAGLTGINWKAFLASSLTLQYSYAHGSQSVSYKTIKIYLAAIRLHHIEHSMPDPTTDDLLHLVCRGIRCLQDDRQRICLPIIINLLHTIKEHLRQSTYTVQEQRMLWAAFTIAFYGFLRVG